MQPKEQLVLWKDWQELFPNNWQRIQNRNLNLACLEIEAIYAIDFDPCSLFRKNGKSLLFSNLYFDFHQQQIYRVQRCLPSNGDQKRTDTVSVPLTENVPLTETLFKIGNMKPDNMKPQSKGLADQNGIGPDGFCQSNTYQIDGVSIRTLSDFITQYHRVSGIVPEWKPSVWKTLLNLKTQLSNQ